MEADYDDSTDSECELDYDITDEISVEAQEQIAKYLTEKHGQQITNVLSLSFYPHFISFYPYFIHILSWFYPDTKIMIKSTWNLDKMM